MVTLRKIQSRHVSISNEPTHMTVTAWSRRAELITDRPVGLVTARSLWIFTR
jgi:hypothetical protein